VQNHANPKEVKHVRKISHRNSLLDITGRSSGGNRRHPNSEQDLRVDTEDFGEAMPDTGSTVIPIEETGRDGGEIGHRLSHTKTIQVPRANPIVVEGIFVISDGFGDVVNRDVVPVYVNIDVDHVRWTFRRDENILPIKFWWWWAGGGVVGVCSSIGREQPFERGCAEGSVVRAVNHTRGVRKRNADKGERGPDGVANEWVGIRKPPPHEGEGGHWSHVRSPNPSASWSTDKPRESIGAGIWYIYSERGRPGTKERERGKEIRNREERRRNHRGERNIDDRPR